MLFHEPKRSSAPFFAEEYNLPLARPGPAWYPGRQRREEGWALECYAYILRCADGTLYCGWTNDLTRRLAAHNAARGARYTRARLPVELVYWEAFPTKQLAMRREAALKKLSRREKLALIARASPSL